MCKRYLLTGGKAALATTCFCVRIVRLRSDSRSKFFRQMCSDWEVFKSKGVQIKRYHCISNSCTSVISEPVHRWVSSLLFLKFIHSWLYFSFCSHTFILPKCCSTIPTWHQNLMVIHPLAEKWFAEVKLMKYMRFTVGQLKCASNFTKQVTSRGGH